MCVCAHIHTHVVCIRACRCVHFVQSKTTEEDGGHVWVFGKTLMSTIWTTAYTREEQGALCETRGALLHSAHTYIICCDSLHKDKDSQEQSFSSVLNPPLKCLIYFRFFAFGGFILSLISASVVYVCVRAQLHVCICSCSSPCRAVFQSRSCEGGVAVPAERGCRSVVVIVFIFKQGLLWPHTPCGLTNTYIHTHKPPPYSDSGASLWAH